MNAYDLTDRVDRRRIQDVGWFDGYTQESSWRKGKLAGFYLISVLFVVLMIVFVGSVIELGLRSWVSDVAGDHRIHEISLTGLVHVSTAGVIVQAYRPKLRVAALQTAILVPLIGTAMSAITGGTVYEWATFLVLAGLMGLLRPAGRNLIRPFTADQFSPWLVGLVAVAAIPLLAFAVAQATLQVSVVDEHAAVEHYSDQAAYVLSILALGILAALKTWGSWFPSWQQDFSLSIRVSRRFCSLRPHQWVPFGVAQKSCGV